MWHAWATVFPESGQPGVRAHLVQGLPGAKLLPEECPDAGDSNLDAVSPVELARQRHPHLHPSAPWLPQVRNDTFTQFVMCLCVCLILFRFRGGTDHKWIKNNVEKRVWMLNPSHPSFCPVPSLSWIFALGLLPLLCLSVSLSLSPRSRLQVISLCFAISQCHFCGLQLVLWLQLHSHKNEHWQVWLAAAGGTVNLSLPPPSPPLTLLCCPDILCLCVWVIHPSPPTCPSLSTRFFGCKPLQK